MAVRNEVGNRYERLVVLERVENNTRGDAQWLCQCDCGNTKIVKGISLRSGHTRSCGCIQKEKVQEQGYKNTYNLIGKRFGRLVVIERIEGSKDDRGKWLCQCDCGGTTITTSDKLISGHSQSCGCLHSKGEKIIFNFLSERGFTFSKEFSFSNLKNKNVLRFDFAIVKDNKLQCLIEFDGIQHFDKNHIFYSEQLKINDERKNQYCIDNNISLHRIRYDEDINDCMQIIIEKEGLI